MQSVVRSSLVGLLALASLTACGDKVNIVQPTSTTPPSVVHGVTVTPNSVPNLVIGASVTLSAAVDADAAVAVRTVAWASSDATVATVDATGKVTGVKAGTVTISAAATADPTVKGAALVTVIPAGGTNPVVTISSINTTICGLGGCNSVPANLSAAAGQLDVILNVDANGQALKSVSATLKCGTDSMTQTQTISTNVAALDANEAAAPVTLSFNTAAFTVNAAGVATVALHNGPCSLSAVANTSTSQSATNSTTLTLANVDGVVLNTSFAAITNAEGVVQPTQATDAGGLPWKSGSVTVAATPVLYSGRTISSVSITVPGATGATQTLTATPYSATWSGSASSGSRVTGLTLTAACNPFGVQVPPANGCEVNNSTPQGITPSVIVLDAAGNDLGLGVLNAGVVGNSTFRLDNTAPQAGTTFMIPGRQIGWINAAYAFTGAGGTSFGATGTTNYDACGDGGGQTAGVNGCIAQHGVSTLGQDGATIQLASSPPVGFVQLGSSGVTGQTTFTYYYITAANYVAASATNGTSTSATSCSTTGWTKITTGNDIPVSTTNTAYVVRVFETDKLGNARCTDLGAAQNLTNSGVFARGVFGVDKQAPVASFVVAGDPSCPAGGCVQDLGKITANPTGAFVVGYSDDASGFNTTPITTKVTRLAIDPATNAPSTVNSAFGCPIGFSANAGACQTAAAAGTIAADPNSAGATSGIDGYYTYTGTIMDVARNTGNTLTRQVVVDRQIPVMGGIAVPATVLGGQSASFASSATDNLDLVGTDYTLTYAITPAGAAQPLDIRANGNSIGVAFDNVLTTAASFSLVIPSFIRTVASTTAGGLPQNNNVLPTQLAVRVYDAAGNASLPGITAINPANIATTPPAAQAITNYAAAQANGATFTGTGFQVANAAANISNCPPSGPTCTPVNATTVTLSASAQGTEGLAFQFLNPFTSVNFYYLDAGYVGASNQWLLIGTATAPTVTDNSTQTIRTFSWTLSTPFDPPAVLPVGALNVIAVGVNSLGDALVSAQNVSITLTNP